ncbi:hypothetical protein BGW38_004865, partial [Lunasporangiospora selenospora]
PNDPATQVASETPAEGCSDLRPQAIDSIDYTSNDERRYRYSHQSTSTGVSNTSFGLPPVLPDTSFSVGSAGDFGQGSAYPIHRNGSRGDLQSSENVSMISCKGASGQAGLPAVPHLHTEEDRSSRTSSLRVKIKTRMQNTLASIRSSSNLREKARAQAQAQNSAQQETAVLSGAESKDTTESSSKNRQDADFWTFTRGLPESGAIIPVSPNNNKTKTSPSKRPPIPWAEIHTSRPISTLEQTQLQQQQFEGGDLQMSSPKQQDLDTVMVSPEMPSLHDVVIGEDPDDETDSDGSIDIIMPGDYDDYTQFAEMPLKMRKKMIAAAQRSGAGDPQSLLKSKRPHPMKRFLTKDKNKKREESGAGGDDVAAVEPTSASGISNEASNLRKNSKKRPKDQDSIEGKRGQEPNKMVKGNSEEPFEWKRAFLKSLHLGRGHKSNPNAGAHTTTAQLTGLQELPVGEAGSSGTQGAITRLQRSDSIQSVRSRSLATSTHPGLLATTLAKPVNPVVRRETLEMAMMRRRRQSGSNGGMARSGADIFLGNDALPLSNALPGSLGSNNGYLRVPGSADGASTRTSTNITNTFTSFTFELANVEHAHAIVSNSAVPGLFNFKRHEIRSMTMSLGGLIPLETEQEFKGFDSDGDAMSGYTGDADVSMEEINFRRRASMGEPDSSKTLSAQALAAAGDEVLQSTPVGREKGKEKYLELGSAETAPHRRMSSDYDFDSDDVPDLPTSNRTRETFKSGQSRSPSLREYCQGGDTLGQVPQESLRMPRRVGPGPSPGLSRKPSRLFISTNASALGSNGSSASSAVSSLGPLSTEKEDKIFAREQSQHSMLPHSRQQALITRNGGSIPTIATGHEPSATFQPLLDSSPSFVGHRRQGSLTQQQQQHLRQTSQSPSSHLYDQYPHLRGSGNRSHHHQQYSSGDTLIPHIHNKNFSTGSTMSAASSATLNSPRLMVPGQHQSYLSRHGFTSPSSASATQGLSSRLGPGFDDADRSRGVAARSTTPEQSQLLALLTPSGTPLKEFDPSRDFEPSTPKDLQAMDFEALLAAAEREQAAGGRRRPLRDENNVDDRAVDFGHQERTLKKKCSEPLGSMLLPSPFEDEDGSAMRKRRSVPRLGSRRSQIFRDNGSSTVNPYPLDKEEKDLGRERLKERERQRIAERWARENEALTQNQESNVFESSKTMQSLPSSRTFKSALSGQLASAAVNAAASKTLTALEEQKQKLEVTPFPSTPLTPGPQIKSSTSRERVPGLQMQAKKQLPPSPSAQMNQALRKQQSVLESIQPKEIKSTMNASADRDRHDMSSSYGSSYTSVIRVSRNDGEAANSNRGIQFGPPRPKRVMKKKMS